jgi:hemerythrin
MTIIWRDEMGIDGGVMDADHKCLIALVNEVDTAHPALTLQRELQVIIAKLTTYAQVHFEREERWQVSAAFLFAAVHRKHHIKFGHDLEAISTLFRKGRSLQQMVALQAHISEVLHVWIFDHIVKADGVMKPYADRIRRNAKGAAALAEAVRLSALLISQHNT